MNARKREVDDPTLSDDEGADTLLSSDPPPRPFDRSLPEQKRLIPTMDDVAQALKHYFVTNSDAFKHYFFVGGSSLASLIRVFTAVTAVSLFIMHYLEEDEENEEFAYLGGIIADLIVLYFLKEGFERYNYNALKPEVSKLKQKSFDAKQDARELWEKTETIRENSDALLKILKKINPYHPALANIDSDSSTSEDELESKKKSKPKKPKSPIPPPSSPDAKQVYQERWQVGGVFMRYLGTPMSAGVNFVSINTFADLVKKSGYDSDFINSLIWPLGILGIIVLDGYAFFDIKDGIYRFLNLEPILEEQKTSLAQAKRKFKSIHDKVSKHNSDVEEKLPRFQRELRAFMTRRLTEETVSSAQSMTDPATAPLIPPPLQRGNSVYFSENKKRYYAALKHFFSRFLKYSGVFATTASTMGANYSWYSLISKKNSDTFSPAVAYSLMFFCLYQMIGAARMGLKGLNMGIYRFNLFGSSIKSIKYNVNSINNYNEIISTQDALITKNLELIETLVTLMSLDKSSEEKINERKKDSLRIYTPSPRSPRSKSSNYFAFGETPRGYPKPPDDKGPKRKFS